MAKNRFEQVDAVQDDAITLELGLGEAGDEARVHLPAAAKEKGVGGAAEEDEAGRMASDPLPAKDAFRSSIKLANELRMPIVVMDEKGRWQEEWGTLYQPV